MLWGAFFVCYKSTIERGLEETVCTSLNPKHLYDDMESRVRLLREATLLIQLQWIYVVLALPIAYRLGSVPPWALAVAAPAVLEPATWTSCTDRPRCTLQSPGIISEWNLQSMAVAPAALAHGLPRGPRAPGSSQCRSLSCWTQSQMRLHWPQPCFSAMALVTRIAVTFPSQIVGDYHHRHSKHRSLRLQKHPRKQLLEFRPNPPVVCAFFDRLAETLRKARNLSAPRSQRYSCECESEF